ASSPEHGVKVRDQRSAVLRQIPSVDELLNRPKIAELSRLAGRELTLEITRRVLVDLRERAAVETTSINVADVERQIAARIEEGLAPSLRTVINATGVVLHTNL